MKRLNIAISGAGGRMGQAVLQCASQTEGVQVRAALVRDVTAAPHNVKRVSESQRLWDQAEAVIDFSRPELTLELAAEAAESGKILVTGTTGFSDAQQATLANQAQKAVIVQSFNMSLGVNLLAALVEQAAARLDADFDIEILEMHHRHKVDAPSGTALMLGEAAAKGRGVPLEEVADKARDGITGERKRGDIGFAVLRGGAVVGDHSAIFAGSAERIELTHRSQSRDIYATGAIQAARWAVNQPPGLYSMRDVLGV